MQKIVPFLWFNDTAEEAMQFYTSIFKGSEILSLTRYGETGPGPKGTVMTGEFTLGGQRFIALNGGPEFNFTPAVSFMVNCSDQEEVDVLWERLSEGGQTQQCGWLQDKYGLSWQIVPAALNDLLNSGDAERSQRVMAAMLEMEKIDIAKLEQAYAR